jgi:hypothetical protein
MTDEKRKILVTSLFKAQFCGCSEQQLFISTCQPFVCGNKGESTATAFSAAAPSGKQFSRNFFKLFYKSGAKTMDRAFHKKGPNASKTTGTMVVDVNN